MLLRSLEITFIGMGVVFLVLGLLALLLRIQGHFFQRLNRKKLAGEGSSLEVQVPVSLENGARDQKIIAAITAAIQAYLAEEEEKKEV